MFLQIRTNACGMRLARACAMLFKCLVSGGKASSRRLSRAARLRFYFICGSAYIHDEMGVNGASKRMRISEIDIF